MLRPLVVLSVGYISAHHLFHEAVCVPREPSRWSLKRYTLIPKMTSPQVDTSPLLFTHSPFQWMLHLHTLPHSVSYSSPVFAFREPREHHQHHNHPETSDGGRWVVSGPAHQRQDWTQVLFPLCVRWALLRWRLLCILPAKRRRIRTLHLWRTWGDCVRRWVEGPVLHRTWVPKPLLLV